ncbi:MAG TPA: hypothetical protein VMI32_05130 [Candidatus Solibacter sp.]|nr:hypothetical protein [Candidatus Solibacter sp.]
MKYLDPRQPVKLAPPVKHITNLNAHQLANQLADTLAQNSLSAGERRRITASFIPKFKAVIEPPPQGYPSWLRRALPLLKVDAEVIEQLAVALA